MERNKKISIMINISFLFLLSLYMFNSSTTTTPGQHRNPHDIKLDGCTGLHHYTDNKSKCNYVKSHVECMPKGYIDYLQIFYCTCGRVLPDPLSYFLLLLWLLLLFYTLANTASYYFCPSLESLSSALNLSPTIAGTTLLPLGNGATDVFSSIVSFTHSGDGNVGINSVLGGATFVSSVVVGVISLVIASHPVEIDKRSFIRDVLFFLFSLIFLLMIVIFGRVSLWTAICFSTIYIVYIGAVFFRRDGRAVKPSSEFEERGIPLLGCADEEKCNVICVAEDSGEKTRTRPLTCRFLGLVVFALELPLYLPRRITIPVVSEEKWSKPFAVTSVTLAPLMLAVLWNTQREETGSKVSLVIYMTAGLIGTVLGNFAFAGTESCSPPKICLLPWLAGGFFMSIAWTYVITEELVSLLVSLGYVFAVNPSVLGLTVLAWGNSIGDLVANVGVAMHGGPDGAQIAISGCYAGPVFNMLVGLGLSLVFASWAEYPSSYVIPDDHFLCETIGFLMGGLLWALVILPKRNMQPDRYLGGGLLVIYLCFLCVKLARASSLVPEI